MALKKKKEYKNGTSAEYHNIGSIELRPYSIVKENVVKAPTPEEKRANTHTLQHYEMETGVEEGYQMIVEVRSYVSEKVRRQASEQFLSSTKKFQKIPKNSFNSRDIFKQAYELIKNSEEFSEAEDC